MELTKKLFIDTCKRYSECDPTNPDNAVVITLVSKPGRKRHQIGLFNISDGFFVYHDFNQVAAEHIAVEMAREAMTRASRFGRAVGQMHFYGEVFEFQLTFTRHVKARYLNESMVEHGYTRIDQAFKRFLGLPHELIVDRKSSAEIHLVATMDSENKMGKNGIQLAFTPEMESFMKIASFGNAVIMSRKTWDSIPEKFRPLPMRTTFVLSRDESFTARGALVFRDLDTALKAVRQNKVFVVGGHELLKEAFPYAAGAFITKFHTSMECEHDAPKFSEHDFNKSVMHIGMHMGVNYSLLKYKKKK